MNGGEFLEKAKRIHHDNFVYMEVPEVVLPNTRITLRCTKHNNITTPTVQRHLYSKSKCRLCYNETISKRLLKTTEWFISNGNRVHNNKYLYPRTHYVGTKQKVIITCPQHGDFLQTPNDHNSGYGCPDCGKIKHCLSRTMTTEQFIKKSQHIHNNKYEYTKSIYTGNKKKIIITCPQHGDFLQIPNSHLNGTGCPTCKTSKAEIAVFNLLTEQNIIFSQQYRIYIVNRCLKIDFVIGNVAIEIDGQQHIIKNKFFHKNDADFKKQLERDMLKDQYCKEHQLQLYHIQYKNGNVKHVVNRVKEILQIEITNGILLF